jgi:spore maturation protein SpmB
MTDKRIYKPRAAELAACFFGVFMLALMIRNSELAIKYVKDALSVCATTLIPALFPFMVVSDIFVKSGCADTLGAMLSAPMRAIFGVRGAGAVPVVLGAICGFPIGARCAVSLFDAGKISKDECERLIAVSSSPSSAFLIGAVGVSLFGSRALGRALYVSTLVSSVLVGIALNDYIGKKSFDFIGGNGSLIFVRIPRTNHLMACETIPGVIAGAGDNDVKTLFSKEFNTFGTVSVVPPVEYFNLAVKRFA